ncbi:MAG: hypothetical protein QOI94_2219 [Acidobacteriaceae bacterium]|nr:hypothetical protein [Acidobacteriaceae bacterium]
MLYLISQLVSFTMRAFASGVLPSGPLMPSSLRTLLTMLGVISSVLVLPWYSPTLPETRSENSGSGLPSVWLTSKI